MPQRSAAPTFVQLVPKRLAARVEHDGKVGGRRRQLQQVEQGVEEAKEHGGVLACGRRRPSRANEHRGANEHGGDTLHAEWAGEASARLPASPQLRGWGGRRAGQRPAAGRPNIMEPCMAARRLAFGVAQAVGFGEGVV